MSAASADPRTGGEVVEVAVGVVYDGAGRILLAQRAAHLHQGGGWEFPGGKLERGETPAMALARELREELGIQVGEVLPLMEIPHRYPERTVRLHVFEVRTFSGEATGLEGQGLDWVDPRDLPRYRLPAADRGIVQAVNLPDLMLITGAFPDESDFAARLHSALARGIRLVQLRAPELDEEAFARLAALAHEACRGAGARLVLNCPVPWFGRLEADGLHLSGARLMALAERPVGPDRLLGASCHDAAQLAQAARVGVDYALLSPVHATASHPEAAPLGWEAFARLVREVPFPVYALGGLTRSDLLLARRHGARGIAAIRGLWDAP